MLSWPAHGSGIIISMRVRQRAPGHHQELEHVVERRGVAAAFPDDRQHFLQVVAEHVRPQQPFAGAHPVDVAGQGVDFAVVRDVAVRVRQRPRRERVRAEALVHQRERRLDVGIGQIRKHRLDLLGRQHPLVDQRVAREADDVAALLRVGRECRSASIGALEPFPDHIQLALEPHARVGAGQAADRGR